MPSFYMGESDEKPPLDKKNITSAPSRSQPSSRDFRGCPSVVFWNIIGRNSPISRAVVLSLGTDLYN